MGDQSLTYFHENWMHNIASISPWTYCTQVKVSTRCRHVHPLILSRGSSERSRLWSVSRQTQRCLPLWESWCHRWFQWLMQKWVKIKSLRIKEKGGSVHRVFIETHSEAHLFWLFYPSPSRRRVLYTLKQKIQSVCAAHGAVISLK